VFFFPEYYPSYRRDWIYRNTSSVNGNSGPDPKDESKQTVPTQEFVPTSQPNHSNFSAWWFWYNHIYNTSSATQSHAYSYRRWGGDRVSPSGTIAGAGGPQGNLRFGPSAEPRPFKSGSPWFAPQRPGTAGFHGSTNVTHPEFTAGSSYRGTTANAIAAARGSSSVGIRGATISRGGFGSHFGGGVGS
jgi:hypothetical protein